MSRKKEKVIDELKELKSFLSDSYGETLDYAIESMKVDLAYDLLYEQVENDSKKEPCDDCISRQEAINALGECPMNWTDSDSEITAEAIWKDTIEMLKSLPSVNPQPKIGHWIFAKTIFDRYGGTIMCSSCHKKWKSYNEIEFKRYHKFCPDCGAKMEEKKE